MKSSQRLSKGMVATCMPGPGNFLGDELLSWCLRCPFVDRLPASSATFECAEPTEAFGLDGSHLQCITEHLRYQFANERLKRTARYYSSNWRTWAAVNIQLAWRRRKTRTRANPPSELGDVNNAFGSMLRCSCHFGLMNNLNRRTSAGTVLLLATALEKLSTLLVGTVISGITGTKEGIQSVKPCINACSQTKRMDRFYLL